jgi:hypothetical protein
VFANVSSPPSMAILTGQPLPVATAVASSLNAAVVRTRERSASPGLPCCRDSFPFR